MGLYPASSIPTGLLSFAAGGLLGQTMGPSYASGSDGTLDPSSGLPSGSDPNQPTAVPGMPGYYWVPNPLTGIPTLVHDTSGGAGGTGTANYHLDPQELQLQYDTLYQDALKAGMTEEDARRQALAGLIENRNSQQVALSNAYGNIAKNAADFAQKPEDAVADLMYRNAMYGKGSGGTPYGSTNNPQFGQYQNALADKFQQMFGPAAGALQTAQGFLLSPPPSDYLSPNQRQDLGQNPNQPIPTPTFTGGSPTATTNPSNPAPGAPPGGAQGGVINGSFMGAPLASGWGFAQGGAASVQPYGISAASGAPNTQAGLTGMANGGLANFTPVSFGGGGSIHGGSGSTGTDIGFANFGTVSSNGGDVASYRYGGTVKAPPMPAEGGLALNLSEPAKIVGIHSGHVYATLAEPRPDGTPRPERLEIKPLKSEVAKDKEYAKAQGESTMTPQQTLATGNQQQGAAQGNPQGQMAGGQMTGMNAYAQGGDITFGQTPQDFYSSLRQTLGNMGAQTPSGQALPDPRMLSGDVYTQTQRDPTLTNYITSGYNALGVPDIQNTINQYKPDAPVQSFFRPMVSFT